MILSFTSVNVVKILAPAPANIRKLVIKANCPVLLFLKFKAIWGNLAIRSKILFLKYFDE